MRWQETARGGTIYYPIWLAYATGVISNDYDVILIDAPASGLSKKQVISKLHSFKPDCIVYDTSFSSLSSDLSFIHYVSNNINPCIHILVGPPTKIVYSSIMDDPVINYIVVGEYELALLYLLNYIFNNRNYNDLVFITNKVISSKRQTTSADLDNMPFVTKTYKAHLPLKKYFLSSALYPEVQIMASRGCPHSCIFCAWPQIFTGKRLRMRSVENVIGEIRWIKKNMPQIREIVFEDDTFSLNPTWVKHFCENMIGQGIDIAWSAQVRVDMDTSILPLMKKSGCRLLIVGFESGNDSMLALMKKGITVDQSISFAQEIKQNNILLHGDFVIGLPGETLSTIKKTEELINIIRPEILQVSIATPFPGTEFYQMCIDNNALTETDYSNYLDKNGHQKAIINYPDLSTDCIKNSVDHILKTYYLSIRYVPLALRQVFRKNGIYEFIRLLKSAIVFLKTHI